MPRFLIFEDVRETRKYIVDADDYESAVAAWELAQEEGDDGSFVTASTISYDVHQLDDAGNMIETYPVVQVE